MIQECITFIPPSLYFKNELNILTTPCLCPLPTHEDTKASFSWNPETGAWYCHASSCGGKGPNIVALQGRIQNLSDEQAAVALWEKHIRPLEPRARTELLHKELRNNPKLIRILKEERLLEVSTLETEKVGYDPFLKRITLPVWLDGRKNLPGNRYWLPKTYRSVRDNEAKIFHDAGLPDLLYQGWRILSDIKDRTIYFMSSELDALLATQDGYLAVSGLHGEGKFNPAWKIYFKGRRVVVCIGADHPKEAEMVARFIQDCGGFPMLVKWPPGGKTKAKDYTEFRQAGIIGKDWLGSFTPKASAPVVELVSPVECKEVLFSDATKAENANVPIRFNALVCGVDTQHYLIPRKIMIYFSDSSCQSWELKDRRDVLYLLGSSEGGYDKLVRSQIVKASGKITNMIPTEYISVYRCQLAKDISEESKQADFSQHLGVSIGFSPKANGHYEIVGMSVSDPKTHAATILIDSVREIGSQHRKLSIQDYEYLRTLTEPLRQPFTVEGLEKMLYRVADDLAYTVTGITDRPDAHLAVLMSYLCPISFIMEGELQRGWCQVLVLGDSRTGKTYIADGFGKLLGVGEIISSENCSFAGLVGGLQKVGERFMLVWGRLPRNHGGHLTIEESSSLSIEDFSKLTDIRSSGVARLDKVGISHQTHAKTRQLYLANPRGGDSISRSSNAVKIVKSLIGANEDIARFDAIIVMATEENDKNKMNEFLRKRGDKYESLVPLETWPLLVRWAWSLEDGDVCLSPKAEETARQLAVKLSEEFHHEAAIFKAEDGRFKLARFAVFVACLQHLVERKTGKVRVRSEHIKVAAKVFKNWWTKECFGYDRWSKAFIQGQNINEARLEKIIKDSTGTGVPFVSFCDMMADKEIFTADDLCECASTDRQGATALLQKLNHEKVVRRLPDTKGSFKSKWMISTAFRKLLSKWSNQKQ